MTSELFLILTLGAIVIFLLLKYAALKTDADNLYTTATSLSVKNEVLASDKMLLQAQVAQLKQELETRHKVQHKSAPVPVPAPSSSRTAEVPLEEDIPQVVEDMDPWSYAVDSLGKDQLNAFAMVEAGNNLLILGKAGSGKSYLVRALELHNPGTLIIAPTGLAAINVRGATIHSALKIDVGFAMLKPMPMPTEQVQTLINRSNLIIIDEISMVRSDLLDRIDFVLRQCADKDEPFGGKQVVMVGDLMQLPPVVTKEEQKFFGAQKNQYKSAWFFDAKAFKDIKVTFLDEIYRQKEGMFLKALNAIRLGDASYLDYLNENCVKPANPDVVKIVTTNKKAQTINDQGLLTLEGKAIELVADYELGEGLDPELTDILLKEMDNGKIERRFTWAHKVTMKKGARIMLLQNGEYLSEYNELVYCVNGDMGTILDFKQFEGSLKIIVRLDKGDTIYVDRVALTAYHYVTEDGKIYKLPLVKMKQYPLRLSWAVTVHKMQGQTLDELVLDNSDKAGFFASGQLYVALSRARTLEGLTLVNPLEPANIITDKQAIAFLTKYNAT